MKSLRFTSVSLALVTLLLLPVAHAADGYAGASFGSGTNTTWNQVDSNAKWTTNGTSYTAAAAGTVYHLNGYNVKAGRIGQTADLGPAPVTVFAGDQLVIDGYNAASGVASTTGAGLLQFELTNTAQVAAIGPRTSATAYTQGSYTANIVTAAPTASEVRTIRGATGVITLNGTLTLNGKTSFNLPSAINDMRFNIEAPVSGAGDIDLSGGSAGGGTLNGYVTWAFRDLTHWTGSKITVLNKHTISFTRNADFYTTNPSAALAFSNTSIGFLNLSADVSFASGKVTFVTGNTSISTTTTVPDGVYTATQLNAMAAAVTGTNTYVTQPWVSEGAAFNTAGTTYKLYVGQAIPAVAPAIVTQPVGQSVAPGATVTFIVAATGSPSPTYQWKKNTTDVPGATATTLTLANVTSADAGNYTVVVTNSGGSVTSAAATLTVQAVAVAPAITTQPVSRTNYIGTTATFSVVATGQPAPTYQWQKDGADVVGATSSTLSLAKIPLSAAGSYTVIVTNTAGSVTSNAAVLTVTDLPTGIDSYANANAAAGDTWNGASVGVKWTPDGGTNYFAASDNNAYHTNGYLVKAGREGVNADVGTPGSMYFTGGTLVVDGFDAASGLAGTSAGTGILYFDLAATNNGPRTSPASRTQANYYVNLVTGSTSGSDVRTIRTGNGVTTLNGTLKLDGNTTFAVPSGVNDVYFQVNSPVTGAGNIELSGGSAGSTTVNGWVTWAFGDLSKWKGAKISVLNRHTLGIINDTDLYANGTELSFSSSSIGFLNLQANLSVAKFTYFTGSTGSPVSHTLPAKTGGYTVQEINDFIAATKAANGTDPAPNNSYLSFPLASEGAANLNVAAPGSGGTTFRVYVGEALPANSSFPLIVTQPQGQTVTVGNPITLTVEASGAAPLAYQWQKDGLDIPGATDASLTYHSSVVYLAGSYTVKVSNGAGFVTSLPAVVAVNKATPTITWWPPLYMTYGTPLSATQLNATAFLSGTYVYTPAAGTVLNAGSNQTLSVVFTPQDTDNYTSATATATITVRQAEPVITWADPSAISYGTALSATQLDATANVAGTFIYTPAAGTVLDVGVDQALSVTFTPDDANYRPVNDLARITVNKATPVVTWSTPAAIGYGTALSSAQLNATASVSGLFTYTPAPGIVLNAGADQTLGATFTPTDAARYATTTVSTKIAVNKAAPVITWAAPAEISAGTALSAAQLNATANVAGVFTYTPASGTVLDEGVNQALGVVFTPTDTTNYTTATASTVISVNRKATPILTWAGPAAITYGTALSAAQLNATADVAGTFSYAPALGTVLGAGGNQILRVTFTPADTTTYNITEAEVLIAVNKAKPTISWAAPAAITYGTALSATQLNATAGVGGTFSYTPGLGSVLDVGEQTLGVTFTPADATNYAVVTGSTTIVVNQATPVISWAKPVAITYGTALSATQLNATAPIPGTFEYVPALDTMLNAGANQTLSVTFTPTDTLNYKAATASVSILVQQGPPVITWAVPADIAYGTALTATQLNATADMPGTFTYTPASGTVLDVGNPLLQVHFFPTDANYTDIFYSVRISVNKAVPVLTWAAPAAITYGTTLSAAQLNASSGGVAGTFAYTPVAGTKLNAGADQALGVTFTPADTTHYTVATTATKITVNQAPNVITFPAPADRVYVPTPNIPLQAYSSSGLPVTCTLVSGPAVVANGGYTLTGAGTVTIRASQAGDANYAPAADVEHSFVVQQSVQHMAVSDIPDKLVTDAPFTINAGTDSNLPVTFTVVSGPATLSDQTVQNLGLMSYTFIKVTLTGAGTVTIRASQAGNAGYTAVADIDRTFTVQSGTPQTITFPSIGSGQYSLKSIKLSASATSGLPVVYTVVSGPATVAGDVLSLTGLGSITVRASQPGDAQFSAAASVDSTFTVDKGVLYVKVDDKTRDFGAPNPTFTFTYDGPADADVAAKIAALPINTVATTASPPGDYELRFAGDVTSDHYTVILLIGTLTISPHDFGGAYFGTFSSGGHWALHVRSDRTATYIGYLPSRGSAIVVGLTINPDGSFTVVSSEIKPLAGATVRALALATPEAPVTRTAAVDTFGILGRINADGTVGAEIPGLSQTLTGALDAAAGPAQASAGLYTASALGTTSGTTYAIVGASGQTLVITTGASVDSASGTVNTSGQLTATTTGGSALSLNINNSAHSVAASITPAGSSTPVVYSGVGSTVTPVARVVNLSVRSQAGTGSQTLIVGAVINGGSKTLLLRGSGPALIPYGVTNALADPAMRLFDGQGTQLDTNDNWDNSLLAKFNELGASTFAANSKDAALYKQLSAGVYSVHTYPATTGTGVVLAELYDADPTATGAEVVNVSARTQVGVDDNILILGFVITGNTPKTLLIRGMGPTLIPLGVTDALADPQLYLYQGSTVIGSNDNWGGTTALKTAVGTVGATPFLSDTSKDAAVLVTLAPGTYTAQVSGVNRTTGVGLVEVYLVP